MMPGFGMQPQIILLKEGTDTSQGKPQLISNINACMAVVDTVRTTLGPRGMDKLIHTERGTVTISNDGATIMKLLDIVHPAAKSLVDVSLAQDAEVGDGTTSVVILAGEFLKEAKPFIEEGVHPRSIIKSYRQAAMLAVQKAKELAVSLEGKSDAEKRDLLKKCAMTTLNSKLVSGEKEFFAQMVVDAMHTVKTVDELTGKVKYPVKAINVLKAHGKSARDSVLLDGYALNLQRAAQGMPKRVAKAKIACLDMNLQKTRMMMGVQVLVSDPTELEKIRNRELDITKERIQKILDSGANVILTTKGIDDMALKYFVEAGAIACRRVPKDDLKRIAKATGATVVLTLADMEGNETFDPANLGQAEEVVEERVADDNMIMIKGSKFSKAVTLLLRGANDYMLDEMDRSIHDSLCVVKRVLESGSVVPGGGAVEAALSIYLEHFATTLGSREQLAIGEFANAALIIPKTLAVNAAKDATELVAALRAFHYKSQTSPDKKAMAQYGLDLVEGKVRNNVEAGVLEPAMSKVKMIQFATEAAITILRIDDLIRLAAAPEGEDE
mmetsp:Transcript_34830/g.77423  ORF Transcript_34830/g.77423 Transcript_34830/m.77423 type:complete len:556 (-) Transcript_34830:641-2308(-)